VIRTASRLVLALFLAAFVPTGVFGQQSPAAQNPAAQQELAAAANALNSIDAKAVSGDAAKAVAAVRRDFTDMQQAVSNPPASGPNDWRSKYSAVERDLTPLIGSINSQGAQTAADQNQHPLDAATRVALEGFRSHLELFYAALMGQSATQPAAGGSLSTGAPPPTSATTGTSIGTQAAPPPNQAAASSPNQPATPPPSAGAQNAIDAEGAAALLDRIELVLNAELGNKPIESGAVGTAGVLPGVDRKSKAGKLTVDRAALDEMLAEVQQLRTMLKIRQ
jgi:hypothetical protein